MKGRIRITADLHPWNHRVEVRLGVEDEKGNFSIAEAASFKPVDDGTRIDPFVCLPPEAAQDLMNDLWRIGIRPAHGDGSAGQAAATQRHLDDLRTIAFHALKVKS